MMDQALLWLKFLSAAALVVGAGLMLTRSAEQLAARMGWGHAFAGFVILGWATSLPELTISVSAVEAIGSAGLSAGNITGSLLFNLAILAVLDLRARRRRIRDAAGLGGLPSLAVFNLVLVAWALFLCLLPAFSAGGRAWIGASSFLALYVLATAWSWRRERNASPTQGSGPPRPGSARRAALRCLLAGGVIVLSGLWLAHLGDRIAATHGLQEGLVGTIFLAMVSSLPELVTGLAAVNLGLHTLAAGSILGSNIFNMAILGLCDLLYQAGPGAGRPLLLDASTAEPRRITANLVAVGLMAAVALVHVRRQAREPEHGPALVWPLATLAIYALAIGLV